MFNTKELFTIEILSGKLKTCKVAFPTDAQWTDLARKRKSIRRKTGRGLAPNWEEPNKEAADLNLITAVMKDGNIADYDKYEASKMIAILSKAEIVGIDREYENFRVYLKVFGTSTSILLGCPTQQELHQLDVEAAPVNHGARQTELYVNLAAFTPIWDRTFVSAEGYAEGSNVPIIHQVAAINEVVAYMKELEEREPGE